jgi:uncharacterized protein YdhG (YjbR/CyaY superfamily)
MQNPNTAPTTIDEYIAGYPSEVQKILQELRAFIRSIVPQAGEKMGYGIPTFTLHGNLVHFGGFKRHIGFFPGSEAVEKFQDELEEYVTSKGTIQFPLDKPLPYDLIRRLVEFCVERNNAKAVKKGGKK